MSSKFYLLAAIGLLAGCGSDSPAPAEKAKAEQRDTVFDPLTSTLDRAQEVQQTVDEQAAALRKQVEEAER
jgi:hypothetical protein